MAKINVRGVVRLITRTLLDQQDADFTFTADESLRIVGSTPGGDASATGGSSGQLWNGASYDRQRNNTDVILLASGSRTTTQTSADQTNFNARGIKVILDVTVVAAAPSVTVSIQAKDPASGKYYTLLTGAAVVTAVTNVYTIYPALVAAANVVANDVLPRTFRVIVTANNANAAIYSVGYSLIL